jgi:hypothetical protein
MYDGGGACEDAIEGERSGRGIWSLVFIRDGFAPAWKPEFLEHSEISNPARDLICVSLMDAVAQIMFVSIR